MEIRKLQDEIVAKIRSTSSISSVSQCISELVFNSLDAKSTAIAVRVNLASLRFQVIDNGKGINCNDLELVGQRHMTSKCSELKDLNSQLKTYGFRGEALANLVQLSQLLEITSKHESSQETYTKTFKNKYCKIVQTKNRPSNGTTILIEGFLHDLPVRKNRIRPEFDLDSIKQAMEQLVIINPNVSFTLRNDLTNKLVISNQKFRHVVDSLINLYPDEVTNNFQLIKVEKKNVVLKTLMHKELFNTKKFQFIYVNKRPVISQQINKLLGVLLKTRGPKKPKQFHAFLINVKVPYNEIDLLLEPSKEMVTFRNWSIIEHCFHKMITACLGSEEPKEEQPAIEALPDSFSNFGGVSRIAGAVRACGFKRKSSEEAVVVKQSKPNETFESELPVEEIEEELDIIFKKPQASVYNEVKGKNLLMDMFLKSTQVYNSQDDFQASSYGNIDTTTCEKSMHHTLKELNQTMSVALTITKKQKKSVKCVQTSQRIQRVSRGVQTNLDESSFADLKSFGLSFDPKKIVSPFFNRKPLESLEKSTQSIIPGFEFNENQASSKLLISLTGNTKEQLFNLDLGFEMEQNQAMFSGQESANLFDWTQKSNNNGKSFFFNKRTGITMFEKPKLNMDNDFSLKKRYDFIPKGQSPILIEPEKVTQVMTSEAREELYQALVKSHKNELLMIKWQNCMGQKDPKKFFDEIYEDKRRLYEEDIPLCKTNKKLNKQLSFDKNFLEEIEFVGQLDKKFLIFFQKSSRLLVVFDQHAVDERIRLETLLQHYKSQSVFLDEPLLLFVSTTELEILRNQTKYLEALGFKIEFFTNGFNVLQVPLCLQKKCLNDKQINLKDIIQVVLNEIIELLRSTGGVINTLPTIMQNIISSEACRGAIKFGDSLTQEHCKNLLKNLVKCDLPFQCAHGRPTLTPLITLN